MNEERYRPFVVGALVGALLWTLTGGAVHAYVISPDWEAMGPRALISLPGFHPLLMLILMGLVFGLGVETAKFIGGWSRSPAIVLFLPLVAGAAIGGLQGQLVTTAVWGFASDTVFRSEDLRASTGAVCGLLLGYPTIMLGIAIRRRGKPW